MHRKHRLCKSTHLVDQVISQRWGSAIHKFFENLQEWCTPAKCCLVSVLTSCAPAWRKHQKSENIVCPYGCHFPHHEMLLVQVVTVAEARLGRPTPKKSFWQTERWRDPPTNNNLQRYASCLAVSVAGLRVVHRIYKACKCVDIYIAHKCCANLLHNF